MSSKRRILITVLCIIGLILSFDLVYIYIKASFLHGAPKSFCSINSFIDCDGVAQTDKAFFLGVPLAIWGVILYLLFLFLTYVDKIKEKVKLPILNVFKNPSSYIASIGLFSFCVSIILACISIFSIHKICILCFATYFVNLFISISAVQKNFFFTDIKNTVVDCFNGIKEYLPVFLIFLIITVPLFTYLSTSLVLAPNIKAFKEFKEFQDMKYNKYSIHGNTLGNPDGDVQIYVYADFMCPFCKIMNVMLHKLAKDDNKVLIIHSNYPLDMDCNPTVRSAMHKGACTLALYALAAEKQGDYWGMTSSIYDDKPTSETAVINIGRNLGLNVDKLYADAHSDEIKELLEQQIYRGINENLIGTPTLVIDGIPHTDAPSYSKLQELVKQSRNRHKKENGK